MQVFHKGELVGEFKNFMSIKTHCKLFKLGHVFVVDGENKWNCVYDAVRDSFRKVKV